MHKVKKKSKISTKIPKPIKIKKEKTEEDRSLHTMSHYIDDRLELVKQIFGSLKPKTITNLAPDFLKKKSMDEIEELCLNELMCISTKRLKSIIDASKCPTDTESSEDSDVEHQEEHISLEEISSDSEIESSSTSAAKKKSAGGGAATGTKKDTKKSAEENGNGGQISVLELLELQARARAIRSQLALEPVTKIEVDSDHENEADSAASKSTNEKPSRSERKRKSNDKDQINERAQKANKTLSTAASSSAGKHSKSKETTTTTISNSNESAKRASKTIRIKRNYRASTIEEDEKKAETEKPTFKVTITKDGKRERSSRSPSPDVITIVPEPETLLISDSSDGELPKVKTAKKNETAQISQKEPLINTEETTKRVRKDTETEEGEITDNDTEKTVEEPAKRKNSLNEKEGAEDPVQDATQQKEIVSENTSEKPTIDESEKAKSVNETNSNATEPASEVEEKEPQSSASSKEEKTQENIPEKVTAQSNEPTENSSAPSNLEEDDDQNDDVISLEGGDLESEMIQHLGGDSNTKSSFATKTKEKEAPKEDDVISLDSSEEEPVKSVTESWHSRYLKSSKVSKVLATSRLGKRVRDKIKKSKRSKKDSASATTEVESAKTNNAFTSKHEDGSMEQYKELLEMRQRKSS